MKTCRSSFVMLAWFHLWPKPGFRRLAAVFVVVASLAHGASISHVSRNLQAVISLVDYNPIAGEETADFDGAGIERPAFSGVVSSSNLQNNNFADTTTSLDAVIDPTALTFSGKSASRLEAQLNFDSSDVASGAFINGSSFAQYSIGFTVASSGTIKLTGNVQASGAGAASIRLERWDGSGMVTWIRQAMDTTAGFATEIALPQGRYIVIATAGTGVNFDQASELTVIGTAGFDFTGQIEEIIPEDLEEPAD